MVPAIFPSVMVWTAAGSGEPIRVFEGESDSEEARWLVEEVQGLARDGMNLKDMAILYRSNAQSRIIEHALFSAGVSYRVYGGLRFFERAEVKHALAYLRLVENPDDDNAFLRVSNFPPRGIGARSMEALQDAARAGNTSLFAAIGGLAGKAGHSLSVFRATIETLKHETRGLPLSEVVDHVIAKSGLVEHYKSEREGADRIQNLAELVNAAVAFNADEAIVDMATGETTDPTVVDPLTAFLSHAALEAGEHQAGVGQDALQMMTVHSAKGLEFSAVFMTGLEEGLFPHEQSLSARDGLEEERRLAYVAITRARERLYLSFAQTRMLHGQTRYNLPSRFFDELPEGLLKWLTPRIPDRRQQRQASFGSWNNSRSPSAAAKEKGFGQAGGGPGFRVGQNVSHAKFGSGVIVDAEGQGNDARVQVNFGRAGVKWLAVAVAKLQAA